MFILPMGGSFGSFLTSSILSQQNEDKKLRAQQFVSSKELIKNDLKPLDRFYLLSKLAPAAFATGDIKLAERYSIELQTAWREVKVRIPFDYAEPKLAKHISHTLLGLIALEGGNLDKAKENLLASGELVGRSYPTLATFGPNMLLAKKLLESGERETVLQYLDSCSGFWRMEDGRLERWKTIIKQGGMPDFGSNTRYYLDWWDR